MLLSLFQFPDRGNWLCFDRGFVPGSTWLGIGFPLVLESFPESRGCETKGLSDWQTRTLRLKEAEGHPLSGLQAGTAGRPLGTSARVSCRHLTPQCFRESSSFSFPPVRLPFLSLSASGITVHAVDGDRILGFIRTSHRSTRP